MAVDYVEDMQLRRLGAHWVEVERCGKCWRRARYGEEATGPDKCGFGVAYRRHRIGFKCTGYRSLFSKEGF